MTAQIIKFQAGERIAGPDGEPSPARLRHPDLAPAFHPAFCLLIWLGVSLALWAAIIWLAMMISAIIQ